MNWIERILGVSPDGGSGALEFLMIAIPAAALCLLNRIRLTGRKADSDRQ